MKKTLLGIACFFAYIFSMQAQILYGTTPFGGNDGIGTINKFIPATNTLIVAKSFESIPSTNGSNPSASLIQASDGKLYGMTTNGGNSGVGIIFSFDPISSTYTKLKDFDNTNGANPYGSLIQASDGKFYGMTLSGGSSGVGVIFSFDPFSSTYTKLIDFNGTNGGNPHGSLMQASNGKLYGMTTGGGSSGVGVIFSFDPLTATYTKLLDFEFARKGANPYGSLIQASDGKLYGMTSQGGEPHVTLADPEGVIFSFDPVSSIYSRLFPFDNYNGFSGGNPYGSLIQASDGKLYGLTSSGGFGFRGLGYGGIFSFDPISSAYTNLEFFAHFDHDGMMLIDNIGPAYGSLLQATDGKLYGMTVSVIFSFDPSASTFTKLIGFNGANGANPSYGSAFIEVRECIATTTYYQDADGDGYGNPNISVKACSQPAGYVTDNTDCNDNPANGGTAIHAPVTYYRDADGDGYGDANSSISVCETIPPAGYVNNNYDCDDHDTAKKAEDERVQMCHNGKPQCVKAKDIQKKLDAGWTLGPCTPATTIAIAKNVEIYKGQSIPHQYKLSNYPNPFAGTSTIKYELPFDSKVSIKVYDLMGRVVATLVDENKKAGTYTVDFKAGNLSKGSLYYRIIATSKEKQFEQTNKMIQIQ